MASDEHREPEPAEDALGDTTQPGPGTSPSDPTRIEPELSPDDPTRIEPALEPSDPTRIEPGPSPGDPTRIEPGPETPPGATADFVRQAREAMDLGDDPTMAPGSAPQRRPSSGSRGGLRSSALERRGNLGEGEIFAGKYELLFEIARGGMGAVYKARQIDLNRIVALKVMLSGAMASDEERRRFKREAESAGNLQHPNIVPVYDIGEVEDNLYFTQEYVSGLPLSKRKSKLSPDQLREVMIQVCAGVHYAHQNGIVHRDLKPDNIMLDRDDVPKIMDFGLAKQVEVVDADGQPSLLTREGAVMGTPHYMPPEQAEGLVSEIDARSDVYTLGVILFELFTGQLPFQARRLPALLIKIFDEDPQPPRQLDSSIDVDMEAIILKALEKGKERRYQSAADLQRDLERQRDSLTISARRATPVYRFGKWARRRRRAIATGAVLVAALAAAGGVAYSSSLEAQGARERQLQERLDSVSLEAGERRTQAQALAEQVGSFFDDAGLALADRATRGGQLAGTVGEGRDSLGQVIGALREFEQREEARTLMRDLEAIDRADLAPAVERVRKLVEVHALLAAAPTKLAAVEAASQAAIEAMSGDEAQDRVGSFATVAEALEAYGRLLAESRGPRGAPVHFGADFEARSKAYGLALQEARKDAFAALRLSENASPEALASDAALAALDAIRARFDSARSGALGVQVANDMQVAAEHLLASLETKSDDPEVRLRGARLAQGLVQRALEADAQREALQPLRLRANATYARLLLELGAFTILKGLLDQEETFDLDERARSDLRRDYEDALEGREQVESRLQAAVKDLGNETVEALGERIAGLEGLAGRARRYGLGDVLAVRLDEVQRVRVERARRDVDEALAAASKSEALSAREQFLQIKPLQELWRRARKTCDERQPYLTEEAYRERLTACDLGLAASFLNAALGREGEDFVDARRLAERARELCQELAAGSLATEAQRAVAAEGGQAAGEVVARLDVAIAHRERRSQAPPGMVLIPGTAGRQVPLGDPSLPRNLERKLEVRPFYLAIHEVTNLAYQAFVDSEEFESVEFWSRLGIDRAERGIQPPRGWSEGRFPKGEGGLPVTGITWYEAQGYAASQGKRLPTDAEWEFVARYVTGEEPASQRRRYPWGTEWSAGKLRRVLREPGGNVQDVSPQGVFDLGGNASEWVVLSGEASARGASFLYPFERLARSVLRLRPKPDYQGPQLGLRLAKEATR